MSRVTLALAALVLAQCGEGGTEPLLVEPAGGDPTQIVLSATTVTFTATAGGPDPANRSIELTSSGERVTGLSASVAYAPGHPVGWLGLSLASLATPSTLGLIAYTGSLPEGTHRATVTIESAEADNSPVEVPVSFTIERATAPTIALSATTSTFVATSGGADPAEQVIQVTNAGEGTLSGMAATAHYAAGEPGGWLEVLLSSPTAPATLTLRPSVGALPEGVYHATVTVASAAAGNGSQDVSVTFIVGAGQGPEIVLNQTSLAFTAVAGEAASPFRYLVLVSNGGSGTLTDLGLAVDYQPGQPTGWLTASFAGQMGGELVQVRATAASLTAGTYRATLSITSPVATNSPQTVAVTLTVTASAAPAISLSASSVSFTAQRSMGNPAQQLVSITNGGTGTLSGLATTITYQGGQPTGWLSADLSATTAPTTLRLDATTGSLVAGSYQATVSVTSPGATNSPRVIDVTFTVTEPPSITLSPSTTRNFTLAADGTSASQEVLVTNGGGGTLSGLSASVTYGGASGWLEAELSSTTAPAELTLTVNRGSLAAGTYQAVVLVSSSGAINSPRTLLVQLTVEQATAPPQIAVSVTQRTFNALQGGPNPPAQQAQVGNSGGGTLTGLQVVENPNVSWLSVSLSRTSAPAMLTFNVTTGSLAAGTYTTTVEVRSPVASNSPQSVTVTFVVSPLPARPTTLRIINDLYGQVAGPNDWGKMNTVVRVRVGPTQSSVLNLTDGAQELLYPWDSTSDVENTLAIPPGQEATLDVSSRTGPYWLLIQNGWWEYFSDFGSWEKHMTAVVGCDGVTTVYKGTIIQIVEPFGDPEVIRLSDWLPQGNYYGSPFCP